MRAAGELVELSPWWGGHGPEPGDVLESRTGRCWVVVEVRQLQRSRARRLLCRVLDDAEPWPEGAVRFEYRWRPPCP